MSYHSALNHTPTRPSNGADLAAIDVGLRQYICGSTTSWPPALD